MMIPIEALARAFTAFTRSTRETRLGRDDPRNGHVWIN